MKHVRTAVLVLLAAASQALAQPPAKAPEGYPAAGSPATVKLLSPGTAPRTALRYTPTAGLKQHMDMTMVMSMSMDMAGMSMPAMTVPGITFGVDIDVTDVLATGDFTYAMAFTGITADGNADSPVVAQILAMGNDLKQIKGTGIVSSRGVTRSTTIDFGKIAGSPMGQSLGSMTDALKNVSAPLPEEEVGVGARWETRTTMTNNGMTLFQRAEFEVVALDGKKVSLKTTLEQTALPQAMSNPALPPGAEVELQKFVGSGSGTTVLDLGGMVPTSEATVDSDITMQINAGGNSQQIGTKTSLKLSVVLKK